MPRHDPPWMSAILLSFLLSVLIVGMMGCVGCASLTWDRIRDIISGGGTGGNNGGTSQPVDEDSDVANNATNPPPVATTFSNLDAPNGVTWDDLTWIDCVVHVDGWPQTMNISGVRVTPGRIHVDYDRLQYIPRATDPNNGYPNTENVNGSIWLVYRHATWDKWVVGTFDFLRVGQLDKHFGPSPGYFDPKPGDDYGIMVSTMARATDGTIVWGDPSGSSRKHYRERSQVYWLKWMPETVVLP